MIYECASSHQPALCSAACANNNYPSLHHCATKVSLRAPRARSFSADCLFSIFCAALLIFLFATSFHLPHSALSAFLYTSGRHITCPYIPSAMCRAQIFIRKQSRKGNERYWKKRKTVQRNSTKRTVATTAAVVAPLLVATVLTPYFFLCFAKWARGIVETRIFKCMRAKFPFGGKNYARNSCTHAHTYRHMHAAR